MSSPVTEHRIILVILRQKSDLELRPWNYSSHQLDHCIPSVDALCSGILFCHPFSCKISLSHHHPAGSKVHWTAHAFSDCLIFFHAKSFQVQNIPCCRRYNGVGLAVSIEMTLLCMPWRGMPLRGREDKQRWTRIYLQRHCFQSFSRVWSCVKISMQINADWKWTSVHPRWHAKWGQHEYH